MEIPTTLFVLSCPGKELDIIVLLEECFIAAQIIGSPLTCEYENLYKFENEEANMKYLKQFEDGECELSFRRGVPIYDLYVKG